MMQKIFLKKYGKTIMGKGAHYVLYCDMQCYLHWSKEDFDNAIIWGEKGHHLKSSTGADISYDCSHNLALARRDSKKIENLEKSLHYFLLGEKIEDVINGSIDNKHPSFYGNIGRCFYYKKMNTEALNCYRKSLTILLKEDDSNTLLNIGYAAKWIGEALLATNETKDALYFLKYSYIVWKKASPFRSRSVARILEGIYNENPLYKNLSTTNDWEIEKYCKDWLWQNA